jgi:predicted DNA-binding antitoxin AbrB/MazE fold protein
VEQTVEAIYEDGVLRPVKPLEGIREHSRVQVTVREEEPAAKHPLAEVMGIMPDEDAEEMRRIIEEEFEKVDLDEWK